MGEPGPAGSPALTTRARLDVVTTLHRLIDTLNELCESDLPLQGSPPTDLPVLLDATEAAKQLSLSRAKVFDLAHSGQIPSIWIGRAMRIPRDPLFAWIEERTTETSSSGPVRLPNWRHLDRTSQL